MVWNSSTLMRSKTHSACIAINVDEYLRGYVVFHIICLRLILNLINTYRFHWSFEICIHWHVLYNVINEHFWFQVFEQHLH